jgi:hypothetical protein
VEGLTLAVVTSGDEEKVKRDLPDVTVIRLARTGRSTPGY